jgi:hypothetical protein
LSPLFGREAEGFSLKPKGRPLKRAMARRRPLALVPRKKDLFRKKNGKKKKRMVARPKPARRREREKQGL